MASKLDKAKKTLKTKNTTVKNRSRKWTEEELTKFAEERSNSNPLKKAPRKVVAVPNKKGQSVRSQQQVLSQLAQSIDRIASAQMKKT